jgi:hypothetical protein
MVCPISSLSLPHQPWAAIVLALFACASRSRLAPLASMSDTIGPSDLAGSMVVPYPPPPAKVVTIPPTPSNPACVYLDGQWVFGSRDWQWEEGGWFIAASGCSFAQARLFWQTVGADRSELRFRAGRWVRAANPAIDCPAASPCAPTTARTP